MLRRRSLAFVLFVAAGSAVGDVVSYEATAFPEDEGWTPNPVCDPDRWLKDGWFLQHVDLCESIPSPGHQQESFRRYLPEFVGEQQFFIEWRMQTDGDRSEIIGVAPASLVAGGFTGVKYHFTIARDQVRLIRDLSLPIVWGDIEPDVPHTYRLELYEEELYIWYIDGQVIDTGVPEGAYPTDDSNNVSWRAKSLNLESTTKWDYIRYGTIPVDGSGDFDSDAQVDGEDFYYFDECFLGLDVDAGPGCRFADFDADTDVDCDDWTAFTLAWTAPDDPPDFSPCAAPPPSIPTASNWGSALLTLVLLTAGATALSRRTTGPSS